jgi:hypothetical protein
MHSEWTRQMIETPDNEFVVSSQQVVPYRLDEIILRKILLSSLTLSPDLSTRAISLSFASIGKRDVCRRCWRDTTIRMWEGLNLLLFDLRAFDTDKTVRRFSL